MTKRERAIKDRVWLKIRRFAVTNSLKAKLADRSDLTDKQKEYRCYIQSGVLRVGRENLDLFVNIGSKYFADKCGNDYRQWIDILREIDELEVNEKWQKGSDGQNGFTKSYRVPDYSRRSGFTTIDFARKASPTKDKTNYRTADNIIQHVYRCCSQITVAKDLVGLPDPIQEASSHDYSRRVFWGDFHVRYGKDCGRLFHSIIEMPRDSRPNLRHRDGKSLFDCDVRSCHPVLLLPLFSDPLERAKYSLLLDNDIYSTIRSATNALMDRDEMKTEFLVCLNTPDRLGGYFKKGAVYKFFSAHFPRFTQAVLDVRSDLALYCQQQEASIMVKEVGQFCSAQGLFWIPCHDGWLGIEEGEESILKKVGDAFFEATGYAVSIRKRNLALSDANNNISLSWVIPSYVQVQPTSDDLNCQTEAQEWFSQLPKHPEPDAKTLKERRNARQRQRKGLRDKVEWTRQTEELRRQARPLWNKTMRGKEGGK